MAWTKASRLQSSHVLAKHLLPSQLTFLRCFCKLNCKTKTASSPVHWVLWHDFDTSREPDVYEFQQLLFGNNLSPFCSQYILPIHTKTQTTDFREAADTGYVNDVLDLCKTIESAQHLQHQLSDLLALAGFKLRKWSLNEPVVMKNIPIEDQPSTLEISKDELPKTKTPGVTWEEWSAVGGQDGGVFGDAGKTLNFWPL